ncbi:MAG: nucleotide exchange factor GrpE [Candidatus Marinimicrobia bacterium]|nr:nucleotide exchange factor GrpE [Candidatus Neomarinimicrobiota bacterium]
MKDKAVKNKKDEKLKQDSGNTKKSNKATKKPVKKSTKKPQKLSKEAKKIKKLENEKDELRNKISELENDVKEFKDKYVRVHAEFENSKKRLEKELRRKVDLITEDIFLDIIHIVDDMERVLAANDDKKSNKKENEGIRLVYNKMLKMLEKYKVAQFDSVDKEFDSDYHDALLIRADNEKPDHTIVEEFEKGYMLKDKVLRHAKVIVSKKENLEVEEK